MDKVYVEKVANTTTDKIIKLAALVGAITVIAGGYTFYLNNLWQPKIQVLSVDFTKGEAEIMVKGMKIQIYGDATFMIGGDWGVRFGSIMKDGKVYYDRLELVKKSMVVEYLKR